MTMYDRDSPQHLEYVSQARAALPSSDDQIPTLRRYWHDPAFRQQCAEERAAHRGEVHARMDAAARRAREERGMEP